MSKIQIAIMTNRDMKVETVKDLISVQSFEMKLGKVNIDIMECSLLSYGRRQVMMEFLKDLDNSFLCFIDDDTTFPRDVVTQLITRFGEEDDLGAVCVNVPYRRDITTFAVKSKDDYNLEIKTLKDSKGLEEVGIITGSIFMLPRYVVKALIDLGEKFYLYLDGKNVYMDDAALSVCVTKELKLKLMVDHDLSKQCGHVMKKVKTYDN